MSKEVNQDLRLPISCVYQGSAVRRMLKPFAASITMARGMTSGTQLRKIALLSFAILLQTRPDSDPALVRSLCRSSCLLALLRSLNLCQTFPILRCLRTCCSPFHLPNAVTTRKEK